MQHLQKQIHKVGTRTFRLQGGLPVIKKHMLHTATIIPKEKH